MMKRIGNAPDRLLHVSRDRCAATRRYVNEYAQKDYLYMQTSQYFISKANQSKVKQSQLADYCDMIREGVEEEDNNHFSENVV